MAYRCDKCLAKYTIFKKLGKNEKFDKIRNGFDFGIISLQKFGHETWAKFMENYSWHSGKVLKE